MDETLISIMRGRGVASEIHGLHPIGPAVLYRLMVTIATLRQWVNQSKLEMNRLYRVAPSLAYYKNNLNTSI